MIKILIGIIIASIVLYYVFLGAQYFNIITIPGFETAEKKKDIKYLIPFYQIYLIIKN